jgi:hypothetical protein
MLNCEIKVESLGGATLRHPLPYLWREGSLEVLMTSNGHLSALAE